MRPELKKAITLSREGRIDEALPAFDSITPRDRLEEMMRWSYRHDATVFDEARKKKQSGQMREAVGLPPRVLFSPRDLLDHINWAGTISGLPAVLRGDYMHYAAWMELAEVFEAAGMPDYAKRCYTELAKFVAPETPEPRRRLARLGGSVELSDISIPQNDASYQPRAVYIVPAFNEERQHARRTIESLLAQEGEPVRIIYVDDGSQEHYATAEYIGNEFRQQEGDGTLIVVRKENGGVSTARNEALRIARATNEPYVAFIDAGDVSLPHRTRRQIDYLQRTGCGLVHARAETIDVNGNPIPEHQVQSFFNSHFDANAKDSMPNPTAAALNLIEGNRAIHTQTVMMTADAVRRTGYFNTFWPRAEDWLFWITAAKEGVRFGFMDETVSQYRVKW